MLERYDRVCALIDLDSIEQNMKQIEKVTKSGDGIYAVIKADGYGHGAIPIALMLESHDMVKGYAVATAEEAMQLLRAGIKKDILIIGYTFPYAYEEMIDRGVRLTVFRRDTLDELNETAGRLNKKAIIHIKVDTGMSRIGISPFDEGLDLVKYALSLKNIEVEGIFTHFARADETDKTNANEQFELFKSFTEGVEDETGFRFKVKHCSNSAAIIEMPHAHMDAVRAGIILYGLWPSDEVSKDKISLKPAMSLVSHITYIKNVPKGTPVSYGGTFVTDRPTTIATVPVGYADGYPRALSNKSHVLIHGKKANILGRVCMDQLMVDVTFIPEAQMGDTVTLLGKNGDEVITMEEIAFLSDHLNYELACDIGKRVPRLFIKDGEYVYSKDYFTDVPVVDLKNGAQLT